MYVYEYIYIYMHDLYIATGVDSQTLEHPQIMDMIEVVRI